VSCTVLSEAASQLSSAPAVIMATIPRVSRATFATAVRTSSPLQRSRRFRSL
jgi:hypothetical protein